MNCPRMAIGLFFALTLTITTFAFDTPPPIVAIERSNISLDDLDVSPLGQTKKRRVFYLPYTMYYVGAYPQSKQVVYLGTVESAMCTEGHRFGFSGDIQGQYTQHVEGYYKASLKSGNKGYYRRAETIGYWRFDRADELVGLRARTAGRYPNLQYVNDFRWYCK